MHLRKRWTELWQDERGSGALEFIVGGVILLVPIVYLIVTLGQIQAQALGVEQAARHVARGVGTAAGADAAESRADRVLDGIVAEYDIDPGAVSVELACVGAHTTCPEPGATIRVTVSSEVALPLVPPVLGLDELARVGVEASAVQKVSRYWSEP
ncbi:TadE/TadG family type IV pilus assembly protein [Microbacterium dauci]|uniref:TadE family protein n=1 Tax=Microbacterium dauci TaxID=3048008 RepID=A0ABT6ZBL1_9MICO|nr:TadE family protein [Microbacterium sp. LX3-4]MDJ1113544.1 TadE family protein [Microbacterium sp. LX3-4]